MFFFRKENYNHFGKKVFFFEVAVSLMSFLPIKVFFVKEEVFFKKWSGICFQIEFSFKSKFFFSKEKCSLESGFHSIDFCFFQCVFFEGFFLRIFLGRFFFSKVFCSCKVFFRVFFFQRFLFFPEFFFPECFF